MNVHARRKKEIGVLDPFLKQRNMTLTDLGRKTEISLTWLSKINRGIAENPSLEVIEIIAQELGARPKDICPGRAEEMTKLAAAWNA